MKYLIVQLPSGDSDGDSMSYSKNFNSEKELLSLVDNTFSSNRDVMMYKFYKKPNANSAKVIFYNKKREPIIKIYPAS